MKPACPTNGHVGYCLTYVESILILGTRYVGDSAELADQWGINPAGMGCHPCQKSVYRYIYKCDAYIYKCSFTFINVASQVYKCGLTFINVASHL